MKKIFISILFFSLPLLLQASTFSVGVKAGREVVNAVEGELVLPSDAQVVKIYTGGSAVLIWVTPPTWNPVTHSISFAGLTPGGFSRTQPLFTLELSHGEARQAGGKLFGYRSDGVGTQIVLEYSFTAKEMKEDLEWPEAFEPVVFSSPDILDGRYAISFAAQDKGTGIERYEHASYWLLPLWKKWKPVASPYPLSGSALFKAHVIRAFDAAGNYRESPIPGPYRHAAFGVGSILIVCALFFVRRRSLPS